MTTNKQPDERQERYAKVLYEFNQESVWPPDYDADDWREFAAEVVSVADREQQELRKDLIFADQEYQDLGKLLEKAEVTIEGVRKTCQPVRDREGPGGMINASQILGLLSPTWPDGNYCAPPPGGEQ